MKEKTYKYQLVVVFDPKIEDKEKVFKKISAWLDGQEIKIGKKDHLGIKELVYEIKKNSKGDFWVMDLESKNALKLDDFNIFLNREISIIRFLILKV